MGLKNLEVYGVDEEGIYHPPSQNVWTRNIDEQLRLRKQVDELQARGTSLENERRMYRAKCKASELILQVALIDQPIHIAQSVALGIEPMPLSPSSGNEKLKQLYDRIDILETAAWTQTSIVAKEFVKICEEQLLKQTSDHAPNSYTQVSDWLMYWSRRFKRALGE